MAESIAILVGAALAFAMFSDAPPARRLRRRVRSAARSIFGGDRP